LDVEEAKEVIENICPCMSKDCPDSYPPRQHLLVLANAVLRDEEFLLDQIARREPNE
jgi:hypothetical protein